MMIRRMIIECICGIVELGLPGSAKARICQRRKHRINESLESQDSMSIDVQTERDSTN